jgi:hypothetical protein
VNRTAVEIRTTDGVCPASVFRPAAGAGPWPAVLVYMDGIGIRPALFELADTIAQRGYFVLLPDLFYRAGPYTAPEPKQLFGDPKVRADWFAKMIGSTDQEKAMRDTADEKRVLGDLRHAVALVLERIGDVLGLDVVELDLETVARRARVVDGVEITERAERRPGDRRSAERAHHEHCREQPRLRHAFSSM